jgi:uncharacterized phage protein gp47/JayE
MQIKDFSTLVSEQVAAIQGKAAQLVDFTIGSILRAVVEAYSAVALWLQGMVLQVLALTRASTSNAADLDSWMADYGLTRLPAVRASGSVTFSRFTTGQQATIPLGAIVQTADGKWKYQVVEDDANPLWNGTAYVIPALTASGVIPVEATEAGAGGNASSGSISILGQAIPYIDTVSNGSAFTNGEDAESDTAFRQRFVLYIASLSKATKAAIEYAVMQVQAGATGVIVENETYAGDYKPGFFYVVADDGSGTPDSDFLDAVWDAIDAVRGLTIEFDVYAPSIVTANVAMAISVASGFDAVTVKNAVQAAIEGALSVWPIGADFPYTKLSALAYSVAGVANASSILLNGGTADVTVTNKQIVRPGTVVIS